MTPFDHTVFTLTLQGWTQKRIAAELNTHLRTVYNVLERMQIVHNQETTTSLIAYLYENGMIRNYRYTGPEIPTFYYLKKVMV